MHLQFATPCGVISPRRQAIINSTNSATESTIRTVSERSSLPGIAAPAGELVERHPQARDDRREHQQ